MLCISVQILKGTYIPPQPPGIAIHGRFDSNPSHIKLSPILDSPMTNNGMGACKKFPKRKG